MIRLLEIFSAIWIVASGVVIASLLKVSASPVPSPEYTHEQTTWFRHVAKVEHRRAS